MSFVRCAVLFARLAAVVGAAGGQIVVVPPVERTEGGASKALISEIRREETKVHVDIERKVSVSLLMHFVL